MKKLSILMFISLLYMFMKKSDNVLMFMMAMEVLVMLLSLYLYVLVNMYMIFTLMMGVVSAVIGLSMLVNYTRLFGNDYLNM